MHRESAPSARNLLAILCVLGTTHSALVPSEGDGVTSRVIIGGSASLVHPHPEVKPTPATFEYQPGVPPDNQSFRPEGVQQGRPTRPPKPGHNKPPKPARPERPEKPDNNDNNPFGWIVDWFQNFKGSRAPAFGNSSDAGALFLQELNQTQTEQLYEILNHTKYNSSSEFQQLIGPNKGFFDWLLEVTGFNRPNQEALNNQKPKICAKCSCGESIKQIRIVGGVETKVNAYPWMAYLKYNGRFYCGASVINNKYLLTAAHCISGFNKDRLEITLLDHDRSTPFETQTLTAKVTNVYKHSRYNMGSNYNNDIALIKVDRELNFDGLLKPVCLPTPKKSFTGYAGVATGWGATEEHGAISNQLREVEVPILANAMCVKTGYGQRITDNMMCAGFDAGKKDSCQGDSGGPLHVRNSTVHQIVGIVSWGEGCAEPNFPGVYTRVNRYLTWINANTRDACYCS